MKTHFVDINEEMSCTRCSLKTKLIVGLFYDYDGDDKKAETVIFIHCMHDETIMC